MKQYLRQIAEGGTLSQADAEGAMHLLMQGESTPEETAAFLMGLRSRGETIDELVGFTRVMRAYAVPVELGQVEAIDLCGTGGDQANTFNISTTVAFVCAGAGVTVAKHGNRSVSSLAGSADVLTALGVNTTLGKEGVEHCLREVGIAFLFAPHFHPALRHVMPVRKALGVRTFFNILGPLCNPAGVRRQLVGAFSREVARTMAEILLHLDADHIITVHAHDGLDEISLASPSTLFEGRKGGRQPEAVEVEPAQHGFVSVPRECLRGGTAEENAEILQEVLRGRHGPWRDVVLLNATYALLTSGRYASAEEALAAARESIDSGAALRRLRGLIEVSNAAPTA